MIHISQQTIGTETVWLVIIPPNTDEPVEISAQYATESAETRGGVGSRRPRRTVPRWQMSYTARLATDDLALLRQQLGTAPALRVAMPFWPDWSAERQGAPALTAPQLHVGWDEGGTGVGISTAGEPSGVDHAAPLLVGRLKREGIDHWSPEGGDVEISIAEDSPWTHRMDIAASDPGSWSWDPNWVDSATEETRDLLEYEQIGYTREQVQDGDDDVVYRRQEAGFIFRRAALRDLLGFFKARRGGFGAFAAPAWATPGIDTPQAPHHYDGTGGRGFLLFADDTLKLDYHFGQWAECKIALRQVMDTQPEEQPTTARLFELWHDADPSDVARLTSHEAPITAEGHTWTPARIELDEFTSSLQPEDDKAAITAALEDLPQVAPVLQAESMVPVRCRVRSATLEDPVATTVLTFGPCIDWEFEGQSVKFSIQPFSGLLKRKIPRFFCSRTCNYSLFDGGCRRVNPAQMDKANWRVSGEYGTAFGNNQVRLVNLGTVPAGLAADPSGWFAGGWVELGSGIDRQYRVVRFSEYYPTGDGWGDAHGSSPTIHLTLMRDIKSDLLLPGAPAEVYAGCDGSYQTCVSKFNNGAAFGGAPFAPEYIRQRSATMEAPGK